jgi:MFS family permease
MFKNKKFGIQTIIFMILGFIYMFFYVGLQNDHINILTPFLSDIHGWTDYQITNPITIAAVVVIIFYLIVGIALIKYGIKVILVPSVLLVAAGCAGIAAAGENYWIYAVSAFLIRTLVIPFQMGFFMLITNWFIRYRGRVMGVITAGSPFFSVVGIGTLTAMVTSMGFDAYYIVAGVLVLLALATQFGVTDTPEEKKFYPDGNDHPPVSEEHFVEKDISLGEILRDSRAWKLIISYGILLFIIICAMAYMAVRFNSLAPADQPEGTSFFVTFALPYLSVGALMGIPVSYLLGWVNDKLGSIRTSLLLTFLYLFAVVPLAFMPVGGSTGLAIAWAFGVAFMTGGTPVMHVCATSYVYGRKLYMAANKWIMTIQAIPSALCLTFMAYFNETGQLTNAYYIMLGMLAVCFVALLAMLNIPDANAADKKPLLKVETVEAN